MTESAVVRCSDRAAALDEPLIGTVDHRRRWLLVEDRSAWGAHAVRDVLGAELEAEAKRQALRVVLVRRAGDAHGADATRRATLVDTATRQMATRTVADLDGLDAVEAASVPVEAWGDAVAGPRYLVCTNGRRDACCALRGRALVAALLREHPDETWECTHLGGHRFAANLVCLPDGIVYGRVEPADGPRLTAEHAAGRLDPALLRGRSAWPPAAQVAEQVLRSRLGLVGLDDVGLVAADEGHVSLTTPDGAVHELDLVAERMAPSRAISCRADELEAPLHWRVVRG